MAMTRSWVLSISPMANFIFSFSVELHVAPSDMGKVIGKQGRIAKAIRTVVKAASVGEKAKVDVDII